MATSEQNSCGQKITSWTIYSLSPKNFTIQYSGGSGVGIWYVGNWDIIWEWDIKGAVSMDGIVVELACDVQLQCMVY